jgi:hypothetical protein
MDGIRLTLSAPAVSPLYPANVKGSGEGLTRGGAHATPLIASSTKVHLSSTKVHPQMMLFVWQMARCRTVSCPDGVLPCQRQIEMSGGLPSRNVLFRGAGVRVDGMVIESARGRAQADAQSRSEGRGSAAIGEEPR